MRPIGARCNRPPAPIALRSSATRDRIARPDTARPMLALGQRLPKAPQPRAAERRAGIIETCAPEMAPVGLAGVVSDEDDAAMAKSAHALQQLDPVGRTAVCAVDGPVRVKRRMRLGRWHCVIELQGAREARRWQRGQDSDRLARGLTRSPGPPQDVVHPPSIGANQPEPPPD
jgi:hypothetical protein